MDDGAAIIIGLMVRLAFAVGCAMIASSKGRNVAGWFFLGLIFSCIALIIVICLSNLQQEEARWSAQEVEQRRLREQLRQEQMKNEALRQHTIARLDQHDVHLGIDTRETAPLLTLGGQPMQPTPLPPPGTPPPLLPDENWYTAENQTQQGPFSLALLRTRIQQGTLPPGTLVWAEGMTEWKPAQDIRGLFSA
jgi:hypothetical protein